MGRRARRSAAKPKAKPKLDTTFDCPFCSNKNVVEVKMDRQALIGNLKCRMCAVTYQMRANYLHEPVDVYSEWIDEATEKKDMMEKQRMQEGAPSVYTGRRDDESVFDRSPGREPDEQSVSRFPA